MKVKTTKKRLLILISIGITIILIWSGICQLYFSGRVTPQKIRIWAKGVKYKTTFAVLKSDPYWTIKTFKKPKTAEEHFKYASKIYKNLERCMAEMPPLRMWKAKVKQIPKNIKGFEKLRKVDQLRRESMNLQNAWLKENKKWGGRFDQAIKSYRIVIDNYPESKWVDDAQFQIPMVYWLQCEFDKQLEEIERFMEKYPQKKGKDIEDWTIQYLMYSIPPPKEILLAELLEGQIPMIYQTFKGDYRRAIKEYNKLIDKYSRDPRRAFNNATLIHLLCCPILYILTFLLRIFFHKPFYLF
ncbi:MAG TPA: tetratricopeptide repeat protein [candidate division CPR3 bacterium]|uniref:Tetratricopeptide repeat protein n=1 Tax=candidate division CPR3 bacterium TaxID=2268181 RepID=A0A7C1SNT9_UNCC3|nr:tetratricopeptide repeat protein [candidate division CPR3 bacterium]